MKGREEINNGLTDWMDWVDDPMTLARCPVMRIVTLSLFLS